MEGSKYEVMPNHDEIYAKQAEMYERMISRQPSLAEVIREIRSYRDLDVADLGAGSGRLSCVIGGETKSLICTDSSQAMLDVLAEKMSALQHNHWTTVEADHRNLPLATASVDLVVSGWSVCYLASSNSPEWRGNLDQVMSEIRRVLRPGGTVIIFETMGTGTELPDPPDFLTEYYRVLEQEYGFEHRWIRLDYDFPSVEEAEELAGFFFGDEMAAKVKNNRWKTVPECAGIWWKHL